MAQEKALLSTEQNNPRSRHIDRADTLTVLRTIHEEDKAAVAAMDTALPALAEAANRIADRLANGGRLFYVGAGTSGRIGVLDASELPATFGVSPSLVTALVPGGYETLPDARCGDEDDTQSAAADIAQNGVCEKDALVGIAASGRTPYTVAAVQAARSRGAFTAALVNVVASPLGNAAECEIVMDTGAEVIEGSTRMKAGTTQKLALNMLSTAAMIRLGKVYDNKMVEVSAINDKLRDRSIRMIIELTGVNDRQAAAALDQCGGHVKTALASILLHCDAKAARAALEKNANLSDLIRRNG